MISLLITLLVFVLVAGLIWWIIGLVNLPAPVAQGVLIVYAVICLLILIGILVGGVSFPIHMGYLR